MLKTIAISIKIDGTNFGGSMLKHAILNPHMTSSNKMNWWCIQGLVQQLTSINCPRWTFNEIARHNLALHSVKSLCRSSMGPAFPIGLSQTYCSVRTRRDATYSRVAMSALYYLSFYVSCIFKNYPKRTWPIGWLV